MESDYQTSKLEKLLHRTIAGLFALSTVCFMIYTTELHYAHAEGDEDLGSASSSLGASVTVGTACNFSGNVDSQHNATITNGINSTDIGKTTLNVTCNDQGGYAVYAIGYTNDEYGNTSLQSNISDDYNISTGTSTSGNTSNWSMKLSTVPGTTTATIENGYSNYHTVPDDYTKVASLNTITDPSTPNTGSSISTTYQAYISPTQPAGTYSGKVKYTLVHPSTAPTPEKPIFMQDTAAIKSKLANVGDEMQAIDTRDGKKYWVTKLADGNIWMTQNLDLELDSTKTYTPADTDVSVDWTPLRSTINFTGVSIRGWHDDDYSPYSASPGDVYHYTSNSADPDSQYVSLSDCQSEHPDCSTHNHVGNYYNWSAAVASNNTNTTELNTVYNNAPDSICPAGWRLPKIMGDGTVTTDNEFGSILVIEGVMLNPVENLQNYTIDGFNKGRIAPLWLTRPGSIASSYGISGVARSLLLHSSTSDGPYATFKLNFNSSYVSPADVTSRDAGYSIRCLVK